LTASDKDSDTQRNAVLFCDPLTHIH